MLDTRHVNSNNVEALEAETQAKYEHLQAILRDMESVLVAYSGGVDSALLLKVAHDVLGTRALGAIAASPAYASEETEEAITVAEQLRIPVIKLETHELEDERYVANDFNRCYFCKTELFGQLVPLAEQHNLRYIAYGVNKDDDGDIASLQMIYKAEKLLRELGFRQVRVRHHDKLARIEVERSELPRLIEDEMSRIVTDGLRKIGYTYVTVDLLGYRTGSMNETFIKRKKA